MRFRRKKTEFEASALLNNTTYINIFNRLKELAITRFKYEGLPDTVDERYLELTLFKNGSSVFFFDDVLGFLALPVAWQNQFTVYEQPVNYRAYAINGYQKYLNDSDSVIIWNNQLHTVNVNDIENYAIRLYNLERIIDVNADAQKTPVIIQGNKEQSLTLKNLYKEYEGNARVIFGYDSLDLNALTVLKTDAPYVADKLYELKTQIWNEALTFLGIPNLTIQKKERVVSDEVSRSLGGTMASRYAVLESRKQAIEKINTMFNLNISVTFRDADTEGVMSGVDTPVIDDTIDNGGNENE